MLHHLRRTRRSGADRSARTLEGAERTGRKPGLLETDGRRLAKGGLILAATVGLLAACETTDAAGEPAPAAVEIAEQNQPVGSKMPSDFDGDLCKANDHQSLVGKPRTDIPVPVDVVNRRVVCTTCPVTEDYSPYRLNIFFDAETDIVEQVRCG